MPATTTKKICFVMMGDTRIPQPCDRLSAIRPLLTTWIFTVVVPADKISVTTLPVVTRRRAGSARADLLVSAPNRQSQSKPGRATAAVASVF